jgi:phosphoserine phosphatase RsbU/P
MNSANASSLRLVEVSPAPAGAAVEDAALLDDRIQTLQTQIASLTAEIEDLRQRDQTVNFYMHRLDEEMRLAARLQQDFLPKALPQVGPVHFHTLFRPAGYVSGDLYDVMRLDETHVGFYMADAVGHGMPAALLTMFIKNALVTKEISANGYRLLPPGESMARLNEVLLGQNLSYATFATAIYGIINTQSLEVTLARGGHPNPILLRADGSTETVQSEGSLLGIFAGETFAQATTRLGIGDRLLIFSDGIEVAFSDDKNVDTERWRAELEKRRRMSSEDLIFSLAQHIDSESGSLSPKDDLTIIIAEVAR